VLSGTVAEHLEMADGSRFEKRQQAKEGPGGERRQQEHRGPAQHGGKPAAARAAARAASHPAG